MTNGYYTTEGADWLECRDFFLGLDLGQKRDYSAIAIIERHERPIGMHQASKLVRARGQGGLLALAPVTTYDDIERHFGVRYLQRLPLQTRYPEIAARVADLVSRPQLRGKTHMAVDNTGVGAPVVDMLRDARIKAPITAITITGGDVVTGD